MFFSHSVGGIGRWSIRSLRCSRWPTWNRKSATPCEKVYEKRGALMGATMTWGISNVAPTRHITMLLTQKPGTQMMFYFWLEKDFVSQGYKRVPGVYCFWYHCVCRLRVSIQFRQAQNAPDANKKQDLAVLLSHCHSSEIPSWKSFHNNDSLHPKKNIVNLCCCRAISHSSRALRRVGPMKLLLALVPQLAAAIVVGSLPEGSDGLPVASGHRPGWLARSGRSVARKFPTRMGPCKIFSGLVGLENNL